MAIRNQLGIELTEKKKKQNKIIKNHTFYVDLPNTTKIVRRLSES